MSAWVSLPKQWVMTAWNKQTSMLQWNRTRSEKLLRFNWTGLYLNCRDYFVGGIGIMPIMLFEFRLETSSFSRHFLKPYMPREAKKRKFRGLYRLHPHLCWTQSLAVEVSESRSFSSNFVRVALVVFWPSASLAGLMSSIDSSSFNHSS